MKFQPRRNRLKRFLGIKEENASLLGARLKESSTFLRQRCFNSKNILERPTPASERNDAAFEQWFNYRQHSKRQTSNAKIVERVAPFDRSATWTPATTRRRQRDREKGRERRKGETERRSSESSDNAAWKLSPALCSPLLDS